VKAAPEARAETAAAVGVAAPRVVGSMVVVTRAARMVGSVEVRVEAIAGG